MYFRTAFVVFMMLWMFGCASRSQGTIIEGLSPAPELGVIVDESFTVLGLEPDSAAEKAGVLLGDKLIDLTWDQSKPLPTGLDDQDGILATLAPATAAIIETQNAKAFEESFPSLVTPSATSVEGVATTSPTAMIEGEANADASNQELFIPSLSRNDRQASVDAASTPAPLAYDPTAIPFVGSETPLPIYTADASDIVVRIPTAIPQIITGTVPFTDTAKAHELANTNVPLVLRVLRKGEMTNIAITPAPRVLRFEGPTVTPLAKGEDFF